MSQVLKYIFLLIFLLIVVSYYKGSSNVLGTIGTNVRALVNTLQGRDATTGNFEAYPTGA